MIQKHSPTWTLNHIRDIHERAQGRYSLTGFKPSRPLPHFDELVVLSTGLTRVPLEGYKEKCNTQTKLGSKMTYVEIDTPIILHGEELYPEHIKLALAKASGHLGTAVSQDGHITDRSNYHRLFYRLEASSISIQKINEVAPEAVELVFNPLTRLSHIDATASVNTVSKVVQNIISDLRAKIGEKIPIFVRIPASRVKNDVNIATEAGVDGIILEGLTPKTGYSVMSALNYCRITLLTAISLAAEALVELGLYGQISLIASGEIRNGADATKALALGADAVEIDHSALLALSEGPAVNDEDLIASSIKDYEEGGMRIARLVNSMTMEMALLARSLGKGDVHSLEPEDLAALTVEASAASKIPLSGGRVPLGWS